MDPRRPARDMLEDLLSRIRGCLLLYHEYTDLPADEDDADLSDEDGDVAFDEEADDAIDTAFRDAVRARATAERHRLDMEPRPATVGKEDAEATEDIDEHEADINLEAEDTCEHLVELVLETEQWDLPRDVLASVLQLDNDNAGRLVALLIA